MAKGLIKDSTLTAIADAIREKMETTGKILPADMAGLIAGLSGVMTGTFTPSGWAQSANLGTTLPKSSNYLFVCVAEKGYTYVGTSPRPIVVGAVSSILGTDRGFVRLPPVASGNADSYVVSALILSGNTVSHDSYVFTGDLYRWWYAYG